MHTNQKIFPDVFCDTTMSALVHACVDPMFVTLIDGTILLANPAACCLFGFDMEEFRTHGRELIVDKTDVRLQELLAIHATGGNWVGIVRLRNKAGETFEADISATTVGARSGPHYGLIVVRDARNRVRTERLLRDSMHRLRFALDAAEIGDWEFDLVSNVARRSLRHDRCFGYDAPVESWAFDTFLEHVHTDDRQRVDLAWHAAHAVDGVYDVEFRVIWPDRSVHWLWSRGTCHVNEADLPVHFSGIVVDITARRAAEQAMLLLGRALDSASNGIMIVDATAPDRPLTYVNAAFEKLNGYTASESVGRNCRFLNRGKADRESLDRIRTALSQGEETQVEIKNFRKDGSPWWNALRISPVRGESGVVTHFVGVQTDVTDRREQQEALLFQANHDSLTGLPNRNRLNDALAHLVRRASAASDRLAVIYIDLDRFKRFNDTMGHHVGDHILRQVAVALGSAQRNGDILGRLGGDEFLLLCPGVDRASVGKLVRRLSRKLRLIPLAGQFDIVPTASIGIALFPEDGLDGVALLKNADLAMVAAKSSGRDRHQFFSPAMETTAHARHTVERELRRAILRGEIGVGYQPQIDLESGALTGIEALARWNHSGLGQVSPTEFIRVAEESGLIGPLGEYILRIACQQHAEWVRTGLCTVPIAVNVSALQFREANFLEMVEGVLHESGLPPAFLEIELTESVVMHPEDASLGKLKALRERGLRLTIDDFGTGYSSLSYLRQFPVSRIKVDRSFVTDLTTNKDSAAITAAIIVLGHSLGFQVVAEGVEHERQAQFLRGLGCDQAQGNLYSGALSASAFAASLLRVPGRPTLVRQGSQSCD